MTRFLFALFLLQILNFSCAPNTETKDSQTTKTSQAIKKPAPNELVASLQKAHADQVFKNSEVVSFDLKLMFGGRERFNGTIYSKTNSGKIKMRRKSDNAEFTFDGTNTYLSPDTTEWKGGRFAVFTWQYFFLAPYKLNDSGTKWDLTGEKQISGIPYNTGKLSFTAGTGDAPDDWYLIYQNKETKRMDGMAYIVTYGGKNPEDAVENAHAIYYSDWQQLSNGIPVASSWKFFDWNDAEGYNGDPIGSASVSNVKFYQEEGEIFAVDANAKLIEK